MSKYAAINSILQGMSPPLDQRFVDNQLSPLLVNIWLSEYERTTPNYRDVVETKDLGFSYLFDIPAGRLIAAWGLSRGKDQSPRSVIASRMRGHPLTNTVGGKRYHRGHVIPHTMGGRTDINLVPQLGAINSGPFQKIERFAVANPGSLYFSYWCYSDSMTQRPSTVEQGCFVAGSPPEIANFSN